MKLTASAGLPDASMPRDSTPSVRANTMATTATEDFNGQSTRTRYLSSARSAGGSNLARPQQQAQMARDNGSDRDRRNRDVADGREGSGEHYGGDRDQRRVRTFRC